MKVEPTVSLLSSLMILLKKKLISFTLHPQCSRKNVAAFYSKTLPSIIDLLLIFSHYYQHSCLVTYFYAEILCVCIEQWISE